MPCIAATACHTSKKLGRGGNGFGRTQASLQPTEEGTQGALTVFQTLSRHPQHIGGAVEHGPGPVVEHLSPTDAVVRAQSQPEAKCLSLGQRCMLSPISEINA